MNSKSMIRMWKKSFQKQTGSLRNVKETMKDCCQNWKMNNWLKEVRPETIGNLQEGINKSKQWIDSKIASKMNWTIDEYHNKVQTSKMDKPKIEESIQMLNQLREKLDKICVQANYGKAAGNGAQILGSGGAITGAVMSHYELPLGQNITNIGNLVHNGGIVIDNASKVIESCFSKKYLKEVQAILKGDKEIAKTKEKWLEYMTQLDANVRVICRVNQSEMKNLVSKVCKEISKLAPSGIIIYEALELMKQGKYAAYIGNDIQIALLLIIIMKLYNTMCAYTLVSDKIRNVPPVLNIKHDNIKILIQILIACYNFTGIYNLLDFEGVPDAELKVDLESDLEVNPAADFKDNPVTYFEADPVADLEADFEVHIEADLEVDSKNDPEAQPEHNPELTVTSTSKLHFQAISLPYYFKSLMDAVSNIKRGESQYSDVLKRIVKALEKELKLIKKTKF